MDFMMLERPSASLLSVPKSTPTVSPIRPQNKLIGVTLTPSSIRKTPIKKCSISENKENIDANLQPILWMEANSVAALPELLAPISPQSTPSSPSASPLAPSTVSPSRLSTPQRNRMKKTPNKRRRQKQLARLY